MEGLGYGWVSTLKSWDIEYCYSKRAGTLCTIPLEGLVHPVLSYWKGCPIVCYLIGRAGTLHIHPSFGTEGESGHSLEELVLHVHPSFGTEGESGHAGRR